MNLREMRAIACYHLGLATHLFIHIPKNAGVAVRKSPLLKNRIVSADPYFHKSRAYTRELAAFMRERGEHHGYQHARLRDLDPVKLAKLQPLAIIRNPWARTVSRFRFAQTAIQNGTTEETYTANNFEAFLDERHKYGGLPFYWHRAIRGWYQQSDYVTHTDGKIGADLIRQEFLSTEVMRYFDLPDTLRHRNISRVGDSDYKSFYTPKTIKIVADWYAQDIKTFGFDFDTAATKNMMFATPETVD